MTLQGKVAIVLGAGSGAAYFDPGHRRRAGTLPNLRHRHWICHPSPKHGRPQANSDELQPLMRHVRWSCTGRPEQAARAVIVRARLRDSIRETSNHSPDEDTQTTDPRAAARI